MHNRTTAYVLVDCSKILHLMCSIILFKEKDQHLILRIYTAVDCDLFNIKWSGVKLNFFLTKTLLLCFIVLLCFFICYVSSSSITLILLKKTNCMLLNDAKNLLIS